MSNPVVYVVLNGELNMSPGKAAAQAVHASMMLSSDAKEKFIESHKRTVIVLEAKNAEQIKNLAIYLDEAQIESDYYIDEGVNEVSAYSATALAVEPIEAEDLEVREIFQPFPLFPSKKEVKKHFWNRRK